MPVIGPLSFALEVPSLEEGIAFYTDAGLAAVQDGNRVDLRCADQERPCITLLGGFARKRLHHIALRADGLAQIAEDVPAAGGMVVHAPEGFDAGGLWVTDPHGMLFHLVALPAEEPLPAAEPFAINAPGRIVRNRRSAILPARAYAPAKPLRLGHMLCFSPDVLASVRFVTEGLGMALADQAQDVIAFTCARKNSDHHVLAFAKSPGIGFHHASFQVNDPDEVGRSGRALVDRAGRGDWGFGRHTIGSNFFHYIQDPWGSWFEYYADMDFIDDHALWTPTNYAMEDSLASWGPKLPEDFVHNYEVSEAFAPRDVAPAS
ncbi:VOC family protein [Novosphingobium terrae]|uniref:VOC family protein n=1 Tax=Novosphingobium terrae TaxID=2726189 RepID=UPI00198172BA|nr:VOC family protein [Novosphingobium terrae]